MAGAREILEEMQKEIPCAICRSYFSQPITLGCGHSFCRECLSSSRTFRTTAFSCPECRQVSQDEELPAVNDHLAHMTDLVRELSSQLLQSTEGNSHCATHKEVFKLFCEDDQTSLCVTCSQSSEHRDHKLSPVQDAAQNCREKLQHIHSQLGNHIEETEKLLAEEENHFVDWNLMIAAEYSKLNEFLMEEKSRCLENVRKENVASQDRIISQRLALLPLILELRLISARYDLDLLLDVKQLLRRSQSALSQTFKPETPDLKEYPIPGLIEMLRQFRVDISIDPISSSRYVTLSEDLKCVEATEDWHVSTKNPEDSVWHFVYSEQVFSSGRQYWEVDVTQLPQWILGIQNPHLKRIGRNMHFCVSRFLLQCVKKEEDYYLLTHPGSLNHRVKNPLSRVGVYLEYTTGTLIFYNVLQCSLIYSFPSLTFTETVTPIFCPGPPLPGAKAGPMILCPVDSHNCI